MLIMYPLTVSYIRHRRWRAGSTHAHNVLTPLRLEFRGKILRVGCHVTHRMVYQIDMFLVKPWPQRSSQWPNRYRASVFANNFDKKRSRVTNICTIAGRGGVLWNRLWVLNLSVITRVPQGKPRVPPNPVFSSDLGHLFFVTAKYDVFLQKKKK